ncbi:MAG: LysM peptidoglycan-binding domain-containing protein, partial [Clostridiales bacterium]|nr:LysM peptidoglycan-binding domain-containing protein [Clostridiales bacterium]
WYMRNAAIPGEDDIVTIIDTTLLSNIPDSVYINRLNAMNSFIKLPYNSIIRNYIIYYTQKMPQKIANIIGLSFYYLPKFEEIFHNYNIPQELKAVAVIESALNPKAVSRANAKGMWQFMYTTAKRYGLEMTSYIDERFDPIESGKASARYLRDSYDIFGDWLLAIASYNCGAGNVNKAIRRSGGSRDFWTIYEYLPRETRGYVPAFVAALYTLTYYPEHNIIPAKIQMPAHIDTFIVKKNLHFGQISEVIGMPIEQIRDLNPQYLHDIIPATENGHILNLPFNYSMAFVDKENEIYGYKDSVYFNPVAITKIKEDASPERIVHKVRSGETLGGLAVKYHTTVTNLKKWNNLRSNTIRVGQRLYVYGRNSSPSSSSASSSSSSSSSTSSTATKTVNANGYVMYTVRKGDTLWDISNKFSGVTLHDIMTLNGFSRNTKIYPGMKIKIKPQ